MTKGKLKERTLLRGAGRFATENVVELLEEAFAIELGTDKDGLVIQSLFVFIAEIDARVDQDRDILGLAVLFELGDDLEAAGARHLEIEDHKVNRMFECLPNGMVAIVRLQNLKPPMLADARQQLDHERFVVDDHHAFDFLLANAVALEDRVAEPVARNAIEILIRQRELKFEIAVVVTGSDDHGHARAGAMLRELLDNHGAFVPRAIRSDRDSKRRN